MKVKSSFVLFLVFCLGCSDRRLLNESEVYIWNNDSLGCKGDRKKIYYKTQSRFNMLIGEESKVIIKYFGSPNHVDNNNNYTYFYYFLTCGLQPPPKPVAETQNTMISKNYSKEAMQLIVRIDKNTDSVIQINGALP